MRKVVATMVAVILAVGGILLYQHRDLLALLGDGNSLIGATVLTSSKDCEGQFYGVEPAPLAIAFKNNGAADALDIKWSVIGDMKGYSRSVSAGGETDKILKPGESMTVCSLAGYAGVMPANPSNYDYLVNIESVHWRPMSL
ncbi:hypothetical protein [Sphingomonas oryzagri]